MRVQDELPGVNMTAMIDIIFMLVIFFILTAKMQEASVNDAIRLAMAPHGKEEKVKDPHTIQVDVDAKGRIYILRTVLPMDTFQKILRKAVADARGGDHVPVVIVGDANTKHRDIKRVMDVCTAEGIWKLKFAALKEKGK